LPDSGVAMRDSHPWKTARWIHSVVVSLLFAPPVAAQVLEDRSPAIKAAYLLQIPRHVFWPKTKAEALNGKPGQSELRIIVIGNSPTYRVLEALSTKSSALPYRVVVRRKRSVSALTETDVKWTHIVYVPAQRDCRLVQAAYPSQPYLLVTDGARGTEAGAAVAFYISENKVRLELAPYQASARGIEFSSKLLRIAGTVRRGPNQAQR